MTWPCPDSLPIYSTHRTCSLPLKACPYLSVLLRNALLHRMKTAQNGVARVAQHSIQKARIQPGPASESARVPPRTLGDAARAGPLGRSGRRGPLGRVWRPRSWSRCPSGQIDITSGSNGLFPRRRRRRPEYRERIKAQPGGSGSSSRAREW